MAHAPRGVCPALELSLSLPISPSLLLCAGYGDENPNGAGTSRIPTSLFLRLIFHHRRALSEPYLLGPGDAIVCVCVCCRETKSKKITWAGGRGLEASSWAGFLRVFLASEHRGRTSTFGAAGLRGSCRFRVLTILRHTSATRRHAPREGASGRTRHTSGCEAGHDWMDGWMDGRQSIYHGRPGPGGSGGRDGTAVSWVGRILDVARKLPGWALALSNTTG